MTKAEFVEKFADKTGLRKKEAAIAIEAFFATAYDALRNGEKIVIPGVFKAEVVERAARTGKNPITGEAIEIPAKKAIKAKFNDKLLG